MNGGSPLGKANDFMRVSSKRKMLPDHIRQEYRLEMQSIIKELYTLLPRFKKSVEPTIYAREREELTVLTGWFAEDSLNIYALESLLQHLKWQRKVFASAVFEHGPVSR